MLDLRKLKELVRLMVANELTELDLRDTEQQVTLRRPSPQAEPHVEVAPVEAAPPASAAPAVRTEAPATADTPVDEDLEKIESPMVGTFYSAPNPDTDPFVTVGSTVDAETTVCIIEAMKIFNEIKAEQAGTIESILVSNGDQVEFGQPMFVIRAHPEEAS